MGTDLVPLLSAIDGWQTDLNGITPSQIWNPLKLSQAQFFSAAALREALDLDVTPDLIVLDIKLPGLNSLDGLAPLRRR